MEDFEGWKVEVPEPEIGSLPLSVEEALEGMRLYRIHGGGLSLISTCYAVLSSLGQGDSVRYIKEAGGAKWRKRVALALKGLVGLNLISRTGRDEFRLTDSGWEVLERGEALISCSVEREE